MQKVTYVGSRTRDGVRVVVVTEDGSEQELEHRVRHSPSGVNWGYGGSGPADLARSILAHHMGGVVPSAGIYQAWKFKVVGGLADEWTLTSEQVQAALDAVVADRGVVCALCGDSGWLWAEQTPDGTERPCTCARGAEAAGNPTEAQLEGTQEIEPYSDAEYTGL